MGASLGALALLHARWLHPGAFSALYLQSGSYFRPRWDRQEAGFPRFRRISRFVGTVLRAGRAAAPIPITLTCGAPEENLANNRAVAAALRRQGHDVAPRHQPRRPQLDAWRDTLDPHLLDLLARAWTRDMKSRATGTACSPMTRTHLIGLLLGTEEDWSGAFEALLAPPRPSIEHGGERHAFTTERVTIEPFDLRMRPRHSLVIDRLAHWYYVPREWIKKVALMDGVYLMNNPFTFQAMEKHSAYCAMMRLGLKVPETWLIPSKQPPADERFAYTAARYNRPFDLGPIAGQIGYPLFMKPFDGGAWVGVSRIRDGASCTSATTTPAGG